MIKNLWNQFAFFLSAIKDTSLSISQSASMLFSSSQAKFWIIAIFSILFLPQAFILNEDINLIMSYETDAGSIMGSIEDLFKYPFYDMHNGYHSRLYGWTYFSINFFVLLPIKLISYLFDIKNKFIVYFAIRLTFFIIGLLSTLAFFEISKRLFKKSYIAITSTLFYIFSQVGCEFFYIIHPETTGILFIFLGILCLFNFIEDAKNKHYFAGLIFLVLASLSKQIFFFLSLPVLFSFFHFYCINQNKNYWNLLFSKKFFQIFFITLIISLSTLFAIYPSAILHFKAFIGYQSLFSIFVDGPYTMSLQNSVTSWIKNFKQIPEILLTLALLPLEILLGTYLYYKYRHKEYFLYIVNIFTICLILTLIMTFNRFMLSHTYLQPCYPFIILNLTSTFLFLYNGRLKFIKYATVLFTTYFVILTLSWNLSIVFPKMYNRFFYKDSVTFKSYEYIANNINKNDKIVYDHNVAIPSDFLNICHYWRGCGNDNIENFKPDYIIFNEKFVINGQIHYETGRLKKYTLDHRLSLIEKIKSNGVEISIYKKVK